MKQDRFLTGILIGIAVLIVVALTVFLTRKDNLVYVAGDTPTGVVGNYVVALDKRDYVKAYSYMASLENKPTLDQFRQAFLNHSIDPSNVGIDTGSVEINGDTATVTLSIIYSQGDPFSSGYRNTEYAQLVREKGVWLIQPVTK
jgi:hypothetical protein